MIDFHVDNSWLEKFSAKLTNASAVTFDVFDTALTRSVETPVDVFAMVEHFLVARHGDLFEGFAELRELSEIDARRKAADDGFEDINFDEIYDAFIARLPKAVSFVEEIKLAELNAERSVLCATPEILEAVSIARAEGKRICFVSDMYLCSNDIKDFLMSSGYPDNIEVIVSSETRKTKATGQQWPLVKQSLGHDAILHIGDDVHSDGHTPTSCGIECLLIDRYRSERRPGGELTRHILPFSQTKRLASLRQKEQTDTEFMYAFGKSFGVVVVGSFIKWLEERVKQIGIEHIFFLSRDGYLLQKAWQAANSTARTGVTESYLYTSRRVLYLADAALPEKSGKLKDRAINYFFGDHNLTIQNIIDGAGLTDVPEIAFACLNHFGNLNQKLDEPAHVFLKSLFKEKKDYILNKLMPIRLQTIRYLEQEDFFRSNVAVVDLGWHGSMQAILAEIDPHRRLDLCGFYYGLWPNASKNRPRTGWMEGAFTNDFIPMDERYGLFNAVALLENLHSAPEGTTGGYSFTGSRYEPNKIASEIETKQFEQIISPFQRGTIDGLTHLFTQTSLNSSLDQQLSIEAAMAAIQRIAFSPSKREIRILGNIKHARNISHDDFSQLVPFLNQTGKYDGSQNKEITNTNWPIGSYICLLEAQKTENIIAFKNINRSLIMNADARTKRSLL